MSEPVPLRPGGGVPEAVGLAERRARRAELGERAQAGRADAAEALAAELSIRLARLEGELDRDAAAGGRRAVREVEVELQRAWQLAFAEERRRGELEEELGRAVRAVEEERDGLREELRAERERAEGYRVRLAALEADAGRWRRPGPPVPEAAPVPAPPPGPVSPALLAREAALAAGLGPGRGGVAPASAPVAPEPEADRSAPDPAAFDAALRRLRAAVEPAEAAPEPAPAPWVPPGPGAPWLSQAVRSLAERDPALAGEALAAFAPVHHLAHPGPLTYRLELAGRPPLGVAVAGGSTRTGAVADPDVVVAGEATAFARALLGAGTRRERRRARLRGRRRARRAVRALGAAPVSLGDLLDAGAPLAPEVAYALLAASVPRAWTGRDGFAFAHDRVVVAVGRRGLRVLGDPPALDLRAEIACPADRVPAFLLGDPGAAEITGDAGVATLLQEWVGRLEAASGDPSPRPDADA